MRQLKIHSALLAEQEWIAWQFNRPAQGDGTVQTFRRKQCGEGVQPRLAGIDPKAAYEITNLDVEGITKASGAELMENRLTVEIEDKPGAIIGEHFSGAMQTGVTQISRINLEAVFRISSVEPVADRCFYRSSARSTTITPALRGGSQTETDVLSTEASSTRRFAQTFVAVCSACV